MCAHLLSKLARAFDVNPMCTARVSKWMIRIYSACVYKRPLHIRKKSFFFAFFRLPSIPFMTVAFVVIDVAHSPKNHPAVTYLQSVSQCVGNISGGERGPDINDDCPFA